MAHVESYSQTDLEQKLHELVREALPICATLIARVGRAGATVDVPIVQVSTRDRPDVADLPRVHQVDGPGSDVWTQWILINGVGQHYALLAVEFQRPAHCQFRLAFRFERHRKLLEAAARSGLIGVAMGPIHVGQDGILRGPVILMQTANPHYIYPFMIAAAISDLDGKVA
jgi:hypothetical protein